MDAAARAELDALRRRAFGPAADIHGDPDALARLIELEDLAHSRAVSDPVDAAADRPEREAPAPDASRSPAQTEPAAVAVPRMRVRRGALFTAAAGIVAVAIAVMVAQPPADPMPPAAADPTPPAAANPTVTVEEPAFVYTADPHSERLLTILTDRAFGRYIELPSETAAPAFPAATALSWAAPLGEYYGWELWIAGGTGDEDDEHCVLIRRDDQTRARCVDAEGQRLGTLRVSLAGAEVPAEELVEPMSDDQRLRFWWRGSGSIDVILGSFDDD